MNILFAGTPEFARQSLHALVEAGLPPRVVLTQPDRAAGRGKKISESAVKRYAVEQGLPVWQPRTLKDAGVVAELAALQPDIMVVAAYGLILPPPVLTIPAHGCVNVHASLLPRWRGAAPVEAAILAGDEQTGIALMQMDAGLDTGAVYLSESIDIGEQDTAGELHERLALLGGELLAANLQRIVDGGIAAQAQDEAQASYAGKFRQADARIDWQQPAETLERAVRAYNPRPGAWFMFDGERVKCWKAEFASGRNAEPGTVLSADSSGILVACRRGALNMLQLQRPGRKPVSAAEFAAQLALDDVVLPE